jgi:3'-5' exoribonuclease 1
VERRESVSRPHGIRRPVRYIVVDLEATCWEKDSTPERMEIIEIGAVCIMPDAPEPTGEFSAFVRPIVFPILSGFCTHLTSIRQEDVESAESFDTVFPRFVEWIGEAPFRLVSWGRYDLDQLRRECKRCKLPFPTAFKTHINLNKEFARRRKINPVGLKTALDLLEIPLVGAQHRGLDDARNTARIAQRILPGLSS